MTPVLLWLFLNSSMSQMNMNFVVQTLLRMTYLSPSLLNFDLITRISDDNNNLDTALLSLSVSLSVGYKVFRFNKVTLVCNLAL